MKTPFETEERSAFRETVRRYVETEIKPHVDEWDEAGDFPWRVHEELGAMGYFGFGVSDEFGGLGFDDAFMRVAAAEELARCGATGVWAGVGGRSISIGPLEHFASTEIRARVLEDVVLGRKGSCLAITEPGGGSDVANLKTTAVRDGDDYVINGSKTFITGGIKGDYFVVGARTGGAGLAGISLFFVEKGTPGFSLTPLDKKMGWWCSDQATLYFDDCRVPAGNMMGEENRGFIAIMENFNFERLSLAAGAGYLRGNPVERIYREVKVFAIGGGSEEIMRDLAARQMDL